MRYVNYRNYRPFFLWTNFQFELLMQIKYIFFLYILVTLTQSVFPKFKMPLITVKDGQTFEILGISKNYDFYILTNETLNKLNWADISEIKCDTKIYTKIILDEWRDNFNNSNLGSESFLKALILKLNVQKYKDLGKYRTFIVISNIELLACANAGIVFAGSYKLAEKSHTYSYYLDWGIFTMTLVSAPISVLMGTLGLLFRIPYTTGFVRDEDGKIVTAIKFSRIERMLTQQKKMINLHLPEYSNELPWLSI